MTYFPFYVDISNQNCLVVGGGKIAYRKIKILLEFNVRIKIIAPGISRQIYDLESEINKKHLKKIIIIDREFEDGDIDDTDFVIAATDNEHLNSHISRLCKRNNKMVNVVDVKEECSFIFPAIIKMKEMVVGISTGGNSPAMAAQIKKEIQKNIPDYYGELIEFLGENRDYIKSEVSDSGDRKKVYDELIELANLHKGNITGQDLVDIVNKYKMKLNSDVL
ncbi:uroporphyrin-III C-methyltransferase/precorrin-2 dehydrogenase/sirohydrochlorin ferrochelatase/precorrin-2 dehydrogenase/sirohydrochlorin ferrochelatase [Mobilisporobacter senegalensis]|uniref:precorrin-2 dehydrogenase n=1 Tax=Mobilisporobacter senegalensis TaxID=1329262 RepID=A0A3N1XNN3_9FIRM|nr:bifunctional precorrin-2 dehydrogenase/sirohydrochlorin ferrochelatase [Mobilisporobacter senegalensis]ROR28289.1 uroporphyrin-III C-methyltransferase/precorrin-2 dehydrogenase/sirohydrochlorin ferrochelatase/precorrin-2 dehydrogenase/sirohydrochlorin ferrochelatase [Mobilisporobacter senegalensis]